MQYNEYITYKGEIVWIIIDNYVYKLNIKLCLKKIIIYSFITMFSLSLISLSVLAEESEDIQGDVLAEDERKKEQNNN